MPVTINIPQFIANAKKGQYLAVNALKLKKENNKNLPRLIYMVRRGLEQFYNLVAQTVVTSAEVKGATTFDVSTLSLTVGRVLTIQVQDPLYNYLTLGMYTIASGDTTAAILTTNIKAVIAANTYGYTISGDATHIIVTSPAGYGATINTKNFLIYWPTGSASTQFSGGVTAVSTTTIPEIYAANLTAEANYLRAITEPYFTQAGHALIPVFVPTGSGALPVSTTVSFVRNQFTVGDASALTMSDGDTVLFLYVSGLLSDSLKISVFGAELPRTDGDKLSYALVFDSVNNKATITFNQPVTAGQEFIINYAFTSH